MATPPITFGNFTGIDFNQIIQAQLSAISIPIGSLNAEVTGEQTQITALGAIGANLSLLQSSLTNLNTDATTPPQGVNVQTGAPFSAATSGSPASGVYNVTVNQLATSQLSASQGYASGAAAVGTGTVTITVGGNAHLITLDSTNDTLSGLAGAINAAGIGVSAQVVNTGLPGAPNRLELSSTSTGAGNAFTVTVSLGGGVAPDFINKQVGPVSLDAVTGTATPTIGGSYTGTLSQAYHFSVSAGGTLGSTPLTIAYTSDSGASGTINVPSNYTAGSPLAVADGLTLALGAGTLNTGDKFSVGVFTPNLATAQNAQVQAGNQIVSSETNSVTNAIAGVTLSLAATGGPSTVTVSPNIGREGADVSTFVNTFNALLSGVTSMTQAQPHQQAPVLANNGGVKAMLENLRESLGTVNLSTLGITIDHKSGQMQFDSGTFAANTIANPSATAAALTSIYNALNPAVTSVIKPSTGLIASATTSIQSQITSQETQITQLLNQATQEQSVLTAEYAKLQAQVLQYQTIQLLLNNQGSSGGSSGSSSPVGSGLTVNG